MPVMIYKVLLFVGNVLLNIVFMIVLILCGICAICYVFGRGVRRGYTGKKAGNKARSPFDKRP